MGLTYHTVLWQSHRTHSDEEWVVRKACFLLSFYRLCAASILWSRKPMWPIRVSSLSGKTPTPTFLSGLARMFEMLREAKGEEGLRVFRDLDEALECVLAKNAAA